MTVKLIFSDEVQVARQSGMPLVALESTLISHGLPHPANIEVAGEAETAVRRSGAVPATTAVIAACGKFASQITASAVSCKAGPSSDAVTAS